MEYSHIRATALGPDMVPWGGRWRGAACWYTRSGTLSYCRQRARWLWVRVSNRSVKHSNFMAPRSCGTLNEGGGFYDHGEKSLDGRSSGGIAEFESGPSWVYHPKDGITYTSVFLTWPVVLREMYSYRNLISGPTILSVYQTGNLSRQSSSSCLRYKFDRYTVRLKPCVPALRYVYRSATLSGRTGYSPGVILVITRATTVRPHGEYLSRMVGVTRINARKSMPRSENTPASIFVRHSGSPTPPTP